MALPEPGAGPYTQATHTFSSRYCLEARLGARDIHPELSDQRPRRGVVKYCRSCVDEEYKYQGSITGKRIQMSKGWFSIRYCDIPYKLFFLDELLPPSLGCLP